MVVKEGTVLRGKYHPHATYKVTAVYPVGTAPAFTELTLQRILRSGSTAFRPKVIYMLAGLDCPLLFEVVS